MTKKVTTNVSQEVYTDLKAADDPIAKQLRQGVNQVLYGSTYSPDLQPEIKERINGHSESPEAFIRSAIAEKLARESNHKRHLNATESISMNFTDFEARFIGDALWDMGDRFEGVGWTDVQNQYKWMARRFHAECKTREEAFQE